MDPAVRRALRDKADQRRLIALQAQVAVLASAVTQRLARHAEFTLTNIAVGTVEQEVSWLAPISGDYAVLVSVTCAATFVGLLTANVKATTKTTTGCTLIVANRAAVQIGAATFDVLAFPL